VKRALLAWTLAGLGVGAAAQDYTLEAVGQMPCRDALPYLKQGRDAGNAQAIYLTAQMVIRRVRYMREYEVYARLLTQAAELEHRAAMIDLGYAYALGDGVARDYAQAGSWLRRAGIDAQGLGDDRSFGYAYAMARRVGARSAMSVPQWLTREHNLRLTVTVVPKDQSVDVALTHDEPEPGDDERRKLLANVRESVEDSLVGARKSMPAPKAADAPMGDTPYRRSWALRVLKSGTSQTDLPRSIDEVRPR
jgi:hypothetical protein